MSTLAEIEALARHAEQWPALQAALEAAHAALARDDAALQLVRQIRITAELQGCLHVAVRELERLMEEARRG